MVSNIHPHPPQSARKKNFTQTISLMVGFVLVVLALSGLMFPAFAGLHLSIAFSLVALMAGVLLFWNGYKNYHARDAFITCLAFGAFFGALALFGFIFGSPGMPNIGYQRFDPLLVRVIPGFIEMGRNDHIFNAVLSAILFGGAIDWWRRHKEAGEGVLETREDVDPRVNTVRPTREYPNRRREEDNRTIHHH